MLAFTEIFDEIKDLVMKLWLTSKLMNTVFPKQNIFSEA